MNEIDQQARQILTTLERQKFADWYNGPFEEYICADVGASTKEEILEQVKEIFRLK